MNMNINVFDFVTALSNNKAGRLDILCIRGSPAA